MTSVASSQLLSEIRDPESPSSRIASLRVVKNEIIGHDQKKQEWIELGILPVLSCILAGRRGVGKNSVAEESNGSDGHKKPRTNEDETCLQSIIIINILAQGGPAFLSPIFVGNTVPSLLSILSSDACPQSITLAILQTLNTIADKLPLAYQPTDSQFQLLLASQLFSSKNVDSLCKIFKQTDISSTTQSCIEAAADLISKTCTEETQKAMLAELGVLDALATKMASFIVLEGFVLPGAEGHAAGPGVPGFIPPPAPENANLTPILRAAAIIIEHSRSRADHLLSSPALMAVFPRTFPELPVSDVKKSPWKSPYPGYGIAKQNLFNPIDSLLPSVPTPQINGSSNFPPLGSQPSYDKQGHFFSPPLSFSDPSTPDEPESALISWLLYIARSKRGLARLAATRMVTIIFRLGLVKKHRIPMLGYLLVPLLVRMVEKGFDALDDTSTLEKYLASKAMRVKEEAPSVLASLVMDSRDLQKYAVESGAIKKMSQLLKESFTPLGEDATPMWSSVPKLANAPCESGGAERRLGPAGVSSLFLHKMKFREGVLKALAALSLFSEDFRKAICDNGVVPHIIDSMKPCDSEAVRNGSTSSTKQDLNGNPIPTLLAACAAARSLTRSISVLRTSLIDAGVAAPICTLVRFHDIEVQIAATAVVSNLALHFSPMKDAIIDADMIPTLCEHSHSSNAKLRLESLWALKHIAYNSTNDIKIKIIEDLGPGWIKQVMSHDPAGPTAGTKAEESMGVASPIEMGTANSAGEQVDILNPIDYNNKRDSDTHDPDLKMVDISMSPKASVDMLPTEGARRRRNLMLNGDLDHTRQLRRDDIQVQEQTFDLLRNLICGSGASEMIDFVFQEIGQRDLFDILAEKLRPKPLSSQSRKDFGSPKLIPVPIEILSSVTYLMIHIAAGLSRHRHLLTLHGDLLKLMVPLFNHANKQIRVNCLWVVINLTFEDDKSDRNSCYERAMKLKAIGVLERINSLKEDDESDVRERTKTALHLIKALSV